MQENLSLGSLEDDERVNHLAITYGIVGVRCNIGWNEIIRIFRRTAL